jgi:hypothetical protein
LASSTGDFATLTRSQQGDDAKAVKVGTRIAVTAEPGDDITSLEIPPDDSATPNAEANRPQTGNAPAQKDTTATEAAPSRSLATTAGKAQKQTYPLYPSVQHLLIQNGLAKEEADKIPATGPNGRLLKGDVLAYLGHIQASYAGEVADRLKKLSHLDLSNIKPAAPKKEATPEKSVPATPTEAPVVDEVPVEVALSVSLKAVMECQRRVQESIGVFLPVSTFIARAAELANEELPRSKAAKASADELFNAVLGLDKIAGGKYSRGQFVPQVSALPPRTVRAGGVGRKKADILDVLAGKKAASGTTKVTGAAETMVVAPLNVLSVSVPQGDERRGRVFLERVKSVLEAEPGRLVV